MIIDKNFGYVYKTTNLVNGRIYIGKKKGGFNPDYFGSGIILKKAINKEGIDNFKLEIMVYAEDANKLNELEKEFIAKYREILGKNVLYNITDGGDGFSGNHTIESKNKIGLAGLGHIVTKSTREKIGIGNSIALKGKPLKHKSDCKCCICKAKRGETNGQNKGEKNGMFGKHYKHKLETIEKIKRTKKDNPYKHSIEIKEKLRTIALETKMRKYLGVVIV